jgi:Dolichyl-phosphate-mannose-protein mannosyltransferase
MLPRNCLGWPRKMLSRKCPCFPRPAFVLFKMTWHANWRAYIDGKPEKTAILSPGFAGVSVPAGRHEIFMRYEPESHKGLWGFAGLLGFMLLFGGERRGLLARLEKWKIPAASAVFKRRLWITAGLTLLALPVCLPLFTSSVLWGHDGFVYFPRLIEVHQNIIHGNLLPRWAPDLGRGTGQPLFLFHPPMIYYFGEFWHLLGFDVKAAMNLACALVVLASTASMFLLASVYFGDLGGWLGAAAYVYAPYFAVDLYVRSAMEEFAAFPFFALALYVSARMPGIESGNIGSLASPRTQRFCCATFLRRFSSRRCWWRFSALQRGLRKLSPSRGRFLGSHAIGFALALGMAAFAWLPALAARQLVFMNRAVEGNGKYSTHFVYLHQLFYSPWGYGLSVLGPDDGMSFALGWSHLLLALLAWVWLSRAASLKAEKGLLRFFAAAAAILCALMLQDALWFWEQIPILQNVQLPWRLLGPAAVCLAFLVAPLGKLLELTPRWRCIGMTGAIALLIVPNLAHLHPGRTVDVDLAFWTPLQLARRGVETTTMAEATPRWITGLPLYRQEAATVLSGDAEVASIGRAPFQWTSQVRSSAPSTLEMSTAWFPGWEARIDGRKVSAGPGTPSGLLTFQVRPGEHTVQVSYGRTGLEKTAVGISAISLILAIAWCWTRHAGFTSRKAI